MTGALEKSEKSSMHPGIHTHTQTSKHPFICLDNVTLKLYIQDIYIHYIH